MSTSWRVLVVDDEAPGRLNLQCALAEQPGWQLLATCASVAEARALLAEKPADLLFLDVQMPRENGLVLARELCQQSEPPLVIFVTAYDSYAVEAFEVHAIDYLLKPFDDQRFVAALARAQALLVQRQRQAYGEALRSYVAEADSRAKIDGQSASLPFLTKVSIRSVGKIETIPLDDVLWMRAAGNYVELHLASRMVLHRIPISQLAARLDPARFIRAHRSILIDIRQIAVLSSLGDGNYQLRLRCGETVPVSERYAESIRQLMTD